MEDYRHDPYQVLGVSKNATLDEIKKSYRKLALKHHPDRHTDPVAKKEAQSEFAKIAGAYEILSDESLRKEWDRGATTSSTTSSNYYYNKNFRFNPLDPYEVFKKDFRDQFGAEYPGASYDFVSHDTPIYTPRTSDMTELVNTKTSKTKTIQDRAVNTPAPKAPTSPEKKKTLCLNPFRRSNKKNDAPASPTKTNSASQTKTPVSPTKSPTKTSPRKAVFKKDPSQETALAIRHKTDIVQHNGGAKDNRPLKMEVMEEKEGPVTKTTTIITRPDGSVEKCVMKTGIPGPPKHKLLEGPKQRGLLKSGKEGQKLLTNGPTTTSTSSPRKAPSKQRKLLTAG